MASSSTWSAARTWDARRSTFPRNSSMAYLLDTNVLSEFLKKSPHDDVIRWFRESEERQHHVSTLTIGEIQKGISKLSASRRKDELKEWFDHLIARYEERLLPFGLETARIWGRLVATLELRGRP